MNESITAEVIFLECLWRASYHKVSVFNGDPLKEGNSRGRQGAEPEGTSPGRMQMAVLGDSVSLLSLEFA